VKLAGFLLVLVALVVAAPATSATHWTSSNYFRSPTGNIACRYNPGGTAFYAYDGISCYTENDYFLVGVQTDGRKGGFARNTLTAAQAISVLRLNHVWVPQSAPILSYRQNWWNGGNRTSLRCFSRLEGMTCKAYVGGYVHGFFISRRTYRVW